MNSDKKRVLLIDDDPSVSAALLMLLKDEYDTHSAGTVEDGIRLFEDLHPNVVILDLHLPDSHGLDALRSIRLKDRSASVIILTGYATLEAVEESMRLGAADCLHKPFDARALKSRLRELTFPQDEPLVVGSAAEVETNKASSRPRPDDMASSAFLHDISNPLTSLLALTELLKKAETSQANNERLVSMIHGNVQYMASLVEQWRVFYDPSMMTADYASLGEIVQQSVELVRPRLDAARVTITQSVSDADSRPQMNRHATIRILVNLLQNAIEAVEPETGRVDFFAQRKENSVEFVVRDNGCGVPADATERIFQPRYTTKERGTGLGLYIARHIVESVNGSISICSRPGRGSIFTIQLPSC